MIRGAAAMAAVAAIAVPAATARPSALPHAPTPAVTTRDLPRPLVLPLAAITPRMALTLVLAAGTCGLVAGVSAILLLRSRRDRAAAAARREADLALRVSEERYRTFIAHSAEGIWRFESREPIATSLPIDEQVERMCRDSTLAECNVAFARMYGYASAEELVGRPLSAFHAPDDPRNIAALRAFIEGGYRLDGAETIERDREGHERVIRNNMVGFVENGALVRVWGTQRDVTELHAAHRALSENEQRLRFVLENSPDNVFIQDADLRYVWVAKPAAPLTREDYIGHTDAQIIEDPADVERLAAIKRRVIELNQGDGVTIAVTLKGQRRTFDVAYAPWRDADGKAIGVFGYARDVTDRDAAATALRNSEERFRRLYESDLLGIAFPDVYGGFADANDAFLRMTGYDRADLEAGRVSWRDMTPPEYAPLDERGIDEARRRGACTPYRKEYLRKDGTRVPTLVGYALLDGSADRYVAFFVDLTAQYAVEQALRDSEERLRLAFEASRMGTWSVELDRGGVEVYDEAECTLLGLDCARREWPPGTFRGLVHEEDRERARLAFEATVRGESTSMELRIVRGDGSVVWTLGVGKVQRDASGRPMRIVGINLDVTAAKDAERALRESEARYRLAVDAAELGSWDYRFDSNTITWDERGRRNFGLASGSQLPEDSILRIHPEDRDAVVASARQALAGNDSGTLRREFRVVWPDGSVHWIASYGRAYFEGEGVDRRPVRLTGVTMDITARRNAETAVRSGEQRLRLALEAGQMGVWSVAIGEHATPGIERFDPQAAAITGLDPLRPEWPPGTFLETLVHPDDRDRVRSAIASTVRRGGRGPLVEYRIVRTDGTIRWLQGAGVLQRDEAGHPVQFVGVGFDVTERRLAEEALRTSEERLQVALAAGRMGAWSWDRLTDAVEWTEGHYTLLGYEPHSIRPSVDALLERVHADDRDRFRDTLRITDERGGPYRDEFRVVHPDGTTHWIEARGHVERDPTTGQTLRMYGVVIDIGHRKAIDADREHLLAAERAARSEVERVARIKDEFLATLSHELRTPINAIVGWSQLLQAGQLSDPAMVAEAVGVIERNARVQSQMISDLLDMNRIVSGKLRMDPVPLDVNEVAAAAADTVRPAALAKGVEVVTQFTPDLPGILGDARRLQQVVWNLLNNAVKFTHSGGRIEVVTSHDADRQGGARVLIEVIDNGVGIDPAFIPYLFDRFSQADGSAARKHGGLGLGLAIVKQLVEMHGGTVDAHSEGSGAGARFSVRLPVAPLAPVGESMPANAGSAAARLGSTLPTNGSRTTPTANNVGPPSMPIHVGGQTPGTSHYHPAVPHRDDVDLRGVSVLIVEDQPDALEFVRRLLAESGASAEGVTSGREAIERIRARKPDLLLSDIGMPEIDGYELIRIVRTELNLPPHELPAAALTAFARADDAERALAAGYQLHLVKPVQPHVLLSSLRSLVRATDQRPA